MSAVWKLFMIGLRQIVRDGMLLILIPAPFLMGAALRLILPLADSIVAEKMNFSLDPWYPLSDTFVMAMTPVMTAMVWAFLMLDERDESIGIYYNITPAGGRAYLMARMGIPMLWAFISSLLVIWLFGLAVGNIVVLLSVAVIGALQGVITCILLVALAGNKVEGLALAKLTSLLLLGLPVAWFIDAPSKYLCGFLPSFWMGEIIYTAYAYEASLALFSGFVGIICSVVWIAVLRRVFLRRTG